LGFAQNVGEIVIPNTATDISTTGTIGANVQEQLDSLLSLSEMNVDFETIQHTPLGGTLSAGINLEPYVVPFDGTITRLTTTVLNIPAGGGNNLTFNVQKNNENIQYFAGFYSPTSTSSTAIVASSNIPLNVVEGDKLYLKINGLPSNSTNQLFAGIVKLESN